MEREISLFCEKEGEQRVWREAFSNATVKGYFYLNSEAIWEIAKVLGNLMRACF